MYLDVMHLEVLPDFKLLLTFENGEKRLFNMQPLLAKKPWHTLGDTAHFSQAHVAYGTVMWPGNIDVAPETLYECSVPTKG